MCPYVNEVQFWIWFVNFMTTILKKKKVILFAKFAFVFQEERLVIGELRGDSRSSKDGYLTVNAERVDARTLITCIFSIYALCVNVHPNQSQE